MKRNLKINEKITKLSLLTLSLLTLAACTKQIPMGTSTNQAQPAKATALSMEEAKAIALKTAGANESAVTNLTTTQDTHLGQTVYDIDFDYQGQEHSYTISAADGSVVEQGTEAATTPVATTVVDEQAKATALKDAGLTEADVTNLTVTQDTDNTTTVYEVEFTRQGTEYSYTIDATTNAILEKEREKGAN